MKRVGNLFEKVISFENLLIALRRAMKGCGRTKATCRFFFDLEYQLLKLQEQLEYGTYSPGAYRYFTIYDPKERVIAVAPFRDRVVHHAVVNVLTPIYERVFIYDSYATRPKKGTHAAIERAQKFLRRWPWYLKADIEKYFDSVNHDILLEILSRKIKDDKLLKLLERIVRNTPPPGKGLPIGNLTSQFLANVYLDPFDHEIKDGLGIKGYIRYMDDFVICMDDRKELEALLPQTEAFLLEKLDLQLKPGATWLNKSIHGLSFLGMRIFPGIIRVRSKNRQRSLRRLRQKVEAWKVGYIEEEKMVQSLTSIAGHLRYFSKNMPVCHVVI